MTASAWVPNRNHYQTLETLMNSTYSENSVRVQVHSYTGMAEAEAGYSQEQKEIRTVVMTVAL